MNLIGRIVLGVALAAAAVLTGCIPERVTWSPDGKQAAVLAADGLRIATPDGKLTDLLVKEPGSLTAWFPDSQRLLVTRKEEAGTWKELTAVLTEAERAEVEKNAKVVWEALQKYEGEWDQFVGTMEGKLEQKEMGDAQWPALLVYLRETQKEKMQAKLGEKWKDVEGLKVSVTVLEVRPLAQGKLGEGKVLHRGVGDIRAVRVAPNGKLVAFTEAIGNGDRDDETLRLSVMSADGAKRRRVTDLASWYPDFTTDSLAIVYMRAQGPVRKGDKPDLRTGWVCSWEVADDQGDLQAKDEKVVEEQLAQVCYGAFARVRALADGTVVFNSPEVRLPAGSKEGNKVNVLWTVRPVDGNDVGRVTLAGEGTGAIPADFFALSPDGKRIVAANGDGKVMIVETATGKVTAVQTEDMGGDKLRTQPVWRSNDQACFVAPVKEPGANGHNAEVVLYTVSTKAVTVLSKDWPEEAVREFLMPKGEK